MRNLLRGRDGGQKHPDLAKNTLIYRHIVTTMILKIMLFLTHSPTCSLQLP
jgi:hypothetical protein